MAKEVIRSIKPFWFYLICEGIKKLEVAKGEPKSDEWNKVTYLYCSKDMSSFNRIPDEFKDKYRPFLGKAGAKFVCGEISKFHKYQLEPTGKFAVYEQEELDSFLGATCLSFEELCKYFGDRPYYKPLYVWHISDLKVYDKPKALGFFYLACDKPTRTDCFECVDRRENRCKQLVRPPQSWCYVEPESVTDAKLLVL